VQCKTKTPFHIFFIALLAEKSIFKIEKRYLFFAFMRVFQFSEFARPSTQITTYICLNYFFKVFICLKWSGLHLANVVSFCFFCTNVVTLTLGLEVEACD